MWDVSIQCDHAIEARRTDIVVANKQERKCTIIDIAVPADNRIGEKENEKVEKYQGLKREIARMWNMRAVQVVPIVVGSLGSVTKKTWTSGWESLIPILVFHYYRKLHYWERRGF